MKKVIIVSFVLSMLFLTGFAQDADSKLFSKKYIKKTINKVATCCTIMKNICLPVI
jgi:hypothetical protein